jgi:hypothetical protein
MNTLELVAFFGTGACDPNKDLKQLLIGIALVAAWLGVVFLISELNKSDYSKTYKNTVGTLIILASLIGTAVAIGVTAISFACKG